MKINSIMVMALPLGVLLAAPPPQKVDTEALFRGMVLGGIQAAKVKDFRSAEELLTKAIVLAEKFPAPDSRTGAAYNTLGLIYKEEKKYSEAEKAYQKALGIFASASGADSLDVGNMNFNLGAVLVADGHYENALPYLRTGNVILGKILGPESPKAVSILCMTGVAYRNLKRLSDASVALKQCADAQEAAGGMQNAELGDALYNLALVYQAQGRMADADSNLKLAEKIREVSSGVTSPEFAEALEAHAAVLKQMGRQAEAEKDEAMAASIRHRGQKTQ